MAGTIPNGALVVVRPVGDTIEPGSVVFCHIGQAQYLHFASAVGADHVRIENTEGFVNVWTAGTNVYGIVESVNDKRLRPH